MKTTGWRWLTVLVLSTGILAAAGCGDDDEGDSGGAATTAPAKQEFAAGTTMAKLQDGERDHDRREVRGCAVRLQERPVR